jgi:adenylate kinase
MNIVLLGAPGSGKGTLSQVLIDKYNFYQISTGDLIREIIKTDSPLGNELKKITSEGKLVSDEFVKQLVLNKIEELKISNKSIIFDGFPRNIDQAK